MSAHFRHQRMAAVALAILAIPAAASAQRGGGMGPRQAGPQGNPVAPIINLRRELNLSARQLVQLDSIERTLLQRNRAVQERARTRMDSLRGSGRGRDLTEEQRTALRARMDSLRTLRQQVVRNDSIARAQVFAVLTDSQRARVREFQAERRGFVRGQAAARRGPGGQQGFRSGQPGARGRMAPQGQGRFRGQGFGPGAGPQGFRGRAGEPGVGPGMGPRGMGGGMGPMGRRPPGAPDGLGPMGMGPRDGARGMRGDMGPGMRRRVGLPGEGPRAEGFQEERFPSDAGAPPPRERRGPPSDR